MAQDVLRELDNWYREQTQGGNRPKLLAKLAVLELCGWIEGELDRIIMVAQTNRLDDVDWVKSNVLDRTHGLTYSDHFRPMLAKIVGEVSARRIESRMEEQYPGDLERLKSMLGMLWKQRGGFAHADVVANVAAQQTFSAPSWSLNQYRIISRLLQQYEQSMVAIL